MALWQTRHAAALLAGARPGLGVEEVVVSTVGDRRTDLPIAEIGGKGVFAKEVQAAVLDGRADFAVHSGKDLPSATPPGLVIAAVLERGDARDALVGATLAELGPGALVATGAPRRRAQLAWLRPDLTFADLRGNVDTRLRRAPEFGALVLGHAGLQRLGRADAVAEVLEPSVLVPQVAQGTIAIECRADDAETGELLGLLEHAPTRVGFRAERAYLDALGGDCTLPAGAHAIVTPSGTDDADGVDGAFGTVELTAVLASLDGHVLLRSTGRGEDPEALGRALAGELLDGSGGRALLL
ncbi:MAG: hydroxymethylbilane synthase [Acidimicrobiia bacterium]|nr:hydroxymethylbilane synthase [Acidimicrobiia bacterium]